MDSAPDARVPNIENWPFDRGALTAGLRRHTGDPALQITTLEQVDLRDTLPALGRLRGLHVQAEGAQGPHQFKLVVKQPQNSGRAGMVQEGIREVSVYAHLADHIPLQIPHMVAHQNDGSWLVLHELRSGRNPADWRAVDYLLAIDHLVALHDRFWELSEFLAVFHWLRRPLDDDRDIYHQAAESGWLALTQNTVHNRIGDDADLLAAIEAALSHVPGLAAELAAQPATLLHGDYWPGNIHAHADGKLSVLDWEQAAIGPGILDLVLFLQKSRWWFDPLPISEAELIDHYRMRMRAANGHHWPDAEWDRLWDAALEWSFISGWVDLLPYIPDAMLDERLPEMDALLFAPFKEATARRQQHTRGAA